MKYYFLAVSYEYHKNIYFANALIKSANPFTMEDMQNHFATHPDIKEITLLNVKFLTKDEYKELAGH